MPTYKIMDFSHLICTFCQLAYILRSPRHDGRLKAQTQKSHKNKQTTTSKSGKPNEKRNFYDFKCWRLLNNKSWVVLLLVRGRHTGRSSDARTEWQTAAAESSPGGPTGEGGGMTSPGTLEPMGSCNISLHTPLILLTVRAPLKLF